MTERVLNGPQPGDSFQLWGMRGARSGVWLGIRRVLSSDPVAKCYEILDDIGQTRYIMLDEDFTWMEVTFNA